MQGENGGCLECGGVRCCTFAKETFFVQDGHRVDEEEESFEDDAETEHHRKGE